MQKNSPVICDPQAYSQNTSAAYTWSVVTFPVHPY